MQFDRVSALLELVRWMGRGLRGDPAAPLRLLEACSACREVGVPVEHVGLGLAVFRRVTSRFGMDPAHGFASFLDEGRWLEEVARENEALLEALASRLRGGLREEGPPVLMGDFVSLLGLYGDVGAHPVRIAHVAVLAGEEGVESVVNALAVAAPRDVRVARAGRLARYLALTSGVEAGGERWRVPRGALLGVLLAARLGDPEANPVVPVWIHLTAYLKAVRETLDARALLELADGLGVRERASRGLATCLALFPEISRYVPWELLGVPAVERRVAIPVAARKLLAAAFGEDEEA